MIHERRRRSALQSIVELRCFLRGLEELRIVTDEELGVLDMADVADAIVATIGIARAPRAGNRRDQVLFEALRQVHHVAGQDRRTGLGQLDHHELAARRVTRRPYEPHRAIIEQVEIPVQPDRLHVLGLGEVARYVVERVADVGPPRRLELVVLAAQCRVLERADFAAVVEMKMTYRDILYVVELGADLGELDRNRIVLGHLEAEALGEGTPPTVGIGDRLIVVASIKHHVALGMLDHIEADRRPVDLARPADLKGGLGEAAQRAGGEDVELGTFLGGCRENRGSEQEAEASQLAYATQESSIHGRSSLLLYGVSLSRSPTPVKTIRRISCKQDAPLRGRFSMAAIPPLPSGTSPPFSGERLGEGVTSFVAPSPSLSPRGAEEHEGRSHTDQVTAMARRSIPSRP